MARPPITAKGEALSRKQLNAALDYVESLGGGGGATWGGITGTLSSQTDLQTELNGKAATSHTHAQSDVTGLVAALAGKSDMGHTHTASAVTDFSEAVDDRVAALLTAGTNITLTYNDGAGTLTIDAAGGGGGGNPAISWVI